MHPDTTWLIEDELFELVVDAMSQIDSIESFICGDMFEAILEVIYYMHSGCVDDYSLLSVIGRGTYAKVLLVRHKQDRHVYAMKVLKKKYVVEKNQERNILTEKAILCEIEHPFLVKLKCCFQDQKKLYFVLEYCPGGELFGLLSLKDKLAEEP